MNINLLYKSPFGRFIVVLLQKTGVFCLGNWFLKTHMSYHMISRYIKKHQIDMTDFKGQKYQTFAEFFSRKRENTSYIVNPDMLISPCDGLLSVYPITEGMNIAMKGSYYQISDLVPDRTLADQFVDGICLVFRLQASDYHHFCAFDDAVMKKANFIPGELHSVQPIVCEKIPVYRLNRRWWSVLDTVQFGQAVQIEVGAMLVGSVNFAKEEGWIHKGEEMGNFELAGSTIILMLSSQIRRHLELDCKFHDAYYGAVEKRVYMGEGIGVLRK